MESTLGKMMRFCHLLLFFSVALLLIDTPPSARGQSESPAQKQENTGQQAVPPKLISSPLPVFPEESRKKGIGGKVVLSIAIDAKGRVSDAKPLSGPPELIRSALDNVKLWQFEPPAHAPVVTTAEIRYGYPQECRGSVSDHGEVMGSGRLLNKRGKVVAAPVGDGFTLPPYLEEDRKVGIGGKMLLSVSLEAGGNVREVHVVKSLSPHLDQAAVETVRTWKFKLVDPNGGPPEDLQLDISYRATCDPQF
jgi:TonB family protein